MKTRRTNQTKFFAIALASLIMVASRQRAEAQWQFVDVSAERGFGDHFPTPGMGTGVAAADFDSDGWLDIYVLVDFGENLLLINRHDNTFVDMAAAAGVNNAMNDMGMALGDYDNDGDLDIYVTNIFMPPPPEHPLGPRFNLLLRNDTSGGVLSFANVSGALGVDNAGFSWGATFLDADRDGLPDLAVTNGWRSTDAMFDPSRFFRNVDAGASPFADLSDAVGFNDTDWGSSLISLDFDRDGDADLVQACMTGPLRLLENRLDNDEPPRHYLTVKPRMRGPNRYALGAIVRVEAGDLRMMRPITAGTSYLGQEPAEALFGLADATIVDTVIVEWPGGLRTELHNVPADQVLTIESPPTREWLEARERRVRRRERGGFPVDAAMNGK